MNYVIGAVCGIIVIRIITMIVFCVKSNNNC